MSRSRVGLTPKQRTGNAVTNLRIEQIPLGDRRLREFVEVPWHLYKGDPCWTPQLKAEYLGSRLLGLPGLLTPRHPYHQHAEVTHFLATRGSEPVGRVSAAINRRFNEYHGTEIGSFGFFETVKDFDVARSLLDAARSWVEKRGMKVLRGPGEYSNATHERQGVLVKGFEYPPTVELTYNPPYYGELLERYGFHKAKDYFAYAATEFKPEHPARLARIAERVRARSRITTRKANLDSLDEEIKLLVHIYNEAWARNWGFLPLTDEEAHALAETLRPVLIPDLLLFAFVDGEPAAVLGALPDLYVPLRPRWRWPLDTDLVRSARVLLQRNRIPRLRIMFMGVRPGFRQIGADALLFYELYKAALPRGYTMAEASMMLEDNGDITRITSAMGLHHYMTWRIYDLEL
jgi:GNAT superfamily N-acetyltransferase